MSARGKPSKGCKRCVSKKVKCDQTQPTCQRCLKAGADCEYRDPFELIHRNQTQAVERIAKDKWRQRALKTHASDSESSSLSPPAQARTSTSPAPSNTLTLRSNVSIPQISMGPELHQMSYHRFFYDFVRSAEHQPDVGAAFFLLPQLFSASSPDSPLYQIVSAVSYANFGGRFKSPEASRQGAVYYGKALSSFAIAMSGPKEHLRTNEMLVGVYLLGMYEMLTSSSFDGTYRMHQHGAASLVRERWGDGTLQDAEKTRYLGAIYVPLVLQCLSEGRMPPAFNPNWHFFSQDRPRGRLAGLMYQAALARHKLNAQNLAPSPKHDGLPPTDALDVDGFFEEALEVDSRLEEWYQETVIGLQWMSEKDTVPILAEKRPSWAKELFSLPGAPKLMHVYEDAIATVSADLYRGTRLWLNMSILRRANQRASKSAVASTERTYFEAVASTTAALMMELIEDICMSVPSLFQLKRDVGTGDAATTDEIYGFRGLLAFWPLITATVAFTQERVRLLDTRLRRAWINCVLIFLWNNLSIAKAGAYKPMSLLNRPGPHPEVPNPDVSSPKSSIAA